MCVVVEVVEPFVVMVVVVVVVDCVVVVVVVVVLVVVVVVVAAAAAVAYVGVGPRRGAQEKYSTLRRGGLGISLSYQKSPSNGRKVRGGVERGTTEVPGS